MSFPQDPLSTLRKAILVVLSFMFPPIVIALLEQTIWCREVALALILQLLGHAPGTIFALFYLFFEYPRRQDTRALYQRLDDVEGGMIQRSHLPGTSPLTEPTAPQISDAPQQILTSPMVEPTSFRGDDSAELPVYSAVAPAIAHEKDNKLQY